MGKTWVTNADGKYVDSNGQVLVNQTNAKLTNIQSDSHLFPGADNTYYDKNTKKIYKCGITTDTYCYTFTDENGITYTGDKRIDMNCTFKDDNGNTLNTSNLIKLLYIDCNGNYFDENGNAYTKDDFTSRVVSDTDGATVIVNNLANGDFSTIIGGTGNLAQGEYSIVAGKNAVGMGIKSVAIGGNAQAILDNSIALGEGAVAKSVHIINNGSTYAGISSSSNEITVFSVGGGTSEDGKTVYRQIQGVAAGEISATSTDAVNGSQLYTEITKVTTSLSDGVVKYDDDTKAKISLAGAEGTIIANVKAGEIAVDSMDAVNGSQLYAEQESRKTADTTLQGNIEAEKTAREGAITALNNDFTTKVGSLTAKDSELEGKISTEKSTRESEVSRLDTRIDGINTSIGNIGNAVFYDDDTKAKISLAGAEGTIIANVKAGEITVDSMDAVNGSQLYAEQESRKTADTTLQENIEAEKTAREGAITALNNDITTKVGSLTAKDSELEGKITDLNTSVTTTVGNLTAKDTEIEGKIGDLKTSLTTEVGKLSTKDTEIEGKVSDLNTAFTTKAGELSAKDTELEGKISTEKSTRESEVSRLDTRIDGINTSIGNIGNAVFYDDDTKAKISLAGAEGTIIANVKAGEITVDSMEAVNGSQLYAEQESRKTADTTLQGNIDAEKSARESAITALNNDFTTKVGSLTAKDSELEGKITDLNTSVTTTVGNLTAKDSELEGKIGDLNTSLTTELGKLSTKDTEIEGKVSDLNTAFTTKAGELNAKDTELEGKISTEKSTRESEVSRLDTRIDDINTSIGNIGNAVFYDDDTKAKISLAGAEGTIIANVKAGEIAADSMEAVNGSQLYAEQESRKTADTSLQGNIEAEKTAREGAITALNNDFTTKVGSLTAKDSELEGKITDLNTSVTTTVGNLTAKDTEIEGKIGDLNTSLTTEVGKLSTKDTEIEGKVSDLNTAFTTKAGELSTKDTEIEGKINTEKSTRESEVSRLDTRIDGINTSIGNIGNAVFYDDDTKAKISLAGAEGTIIANVKAGEIAADSMEAVNGSQLYAEQESRKNDIAQINLGLNQEKQLRESKDEALSNAVNNEVSNRITAINDLRLEINGAVTSAIENVVSYADLSKQKVSFGGTNGTLLTNLKNGNVASGSTDAITGDQLYQEKQQRENDIRAINSRLNNITTSSGSINSVDYDNADKISITLKGQNGTTLKNVGSGNIAAGSMEAINGGQLYDETQARIDGDNALRREFGDYVAGITDNSISYDTDSNNGSVTFKGQNGTTLKNVSQGNVTSNSMEAVNGSQLYATNHKIDSLSNKIGTVKNGNYVKENDTIGENINSLDEAVASNSVAIGDIDNRISSGFNILSQKVNNVGAHAAALAALNPVAENDAKFSFAAGMGSYHNARAGAIGMFYHPDDRYQFSIGGTTGNGEHMYNIGFSIGLDKNVGGPFSNKKAMIREIVSLRDANKEQAKLIDVQNNEISNLKKSKEAQEQRLAEQDAKIDKLMKLVESLASNKH